MICVVDYGMGNLRSVEKALQKLGHAACVTGDPEQVERAERLILPGVGAFGAAMERLRRPAGAGGTLEEAIRRAHRKGTPILGICLGMQLLLQESEELGRHEGLGLLPGRVLRFSLEAQPELKVPHMGWNSLSFPRPSALFAGVDPGASVYFVHSYLCVPEEREVVTAECRHGAPFCAAFSRGTLHGAQFHPEKSGSVGLRILANFGGGPA